MNHTPLHELPSDALLTPAAAGRSLPFPVSPSTVVRWARAGLLGLDGRIHRLEVLRAGHRSYTTAGRLRAFLERLGSQAVEDAPLRRREVSR
jgi:hypothetical protein